MPRRRPAALSAAVIVIAVVACWLVSVGHERDARGQTAVNIPANVAPEAQHYDQGQVDWAFSSQGGFRTLRLTGKMDVTFGPLYVTVKTAQGATVFLRENLRFAGPLAQTPEFGNQ